MKSVISIVAVILLAVLFVLPSSEAGSRSRTVVHHQVLAGECDVAASTCSGPSRVVTKTRTTALSCDCDTVTVKCRSVQTPDKIVVIRKVK